VAAVMAVQHLEVVLTVMEQTLLQTPEVAAVLALMSSNSKQTPVTEHLVL
jgi:hypothetical protein